MIDGDEFAAIVVRSAIKLVVAVAVVVAGIAFAIGYFVAS